MKKLKSSLTNMVAVLTGIAVIAGGILAYVNAKTAPVIEKINAESLANGIKDVMGSEDVQVASPDTVNNEGKDYVIYAVSDPSGAPIGRAVQSSSNGFGGELKVLVGFDNNGAILGYKILATSETPGLGAKAALWFQKEGKGNIIGMTPNDENTFQVSKDGGKVDAITASTITSRAFLLAVRNAYNAFMASSQDEDTPCDDKPCDNKCQQQCQQSCDNQCQQQCDKTCNEQCQQSCDGQTGATQQAENK